MITTHRTRRVSCAALLSAALLSTTPLVTPLAGAESNSSLSSPASTTETTGSSFPGSSDPIPADDLAAGDRINELNKLPDTTAGVTYTALYTPIDDTVTPNSSSQLAAVPGADVANVNTSVACPDSPPVEHAKMPQTPATIGLASGASSDPRATTHRHPTLTARASRTPLVLEGDCFCP